MTYKKVDEAIAYVNAHERPLGLYYFGADQAEEAQVLNRTHLRRLDRERRDPSTWPRRTCPSAVSDHRAWAAITASTASRPSAMRAAVYTPAGARRCRSSSGFKPPYGAATRKAIARDLKV